MPLHLDYLVWIFLLIHFNLMFNGGVIEADSSRGGEGQEAITPPRGWNSYDSFCWNINETQFLQNAHLVAQRLAPHGYQYVVVDFLWYRRKDKAGASTNSGGTDTIDEWGRLVPDPTRWPSSKNGQGFTQVASLVHNMGLKFGIHVMGGLSLQAYNDNTPIFDTIKGKAYEEDGRVWRAKDIGMKDKVCGWMDHGFMAVNISLGAGKAFLRSLYTQYAHWGVDFVKLDCVFGDDFNQNEISYVSELLGGFDRPILYSLSPGRNVTPDLARKINGLVNMYRITADDWDQWDHVKSHFNISRDFAGANMMGAEGLRGRSWPDLDMLPLGWLSQADSNEGPHRQCNLTLDEQKTQVTLWSMAKSPLMFGGDMRKLDDTTYGLITNPVLLEINAFSTNNHEYPSVTGSPASSERKHHEFESNNQQSAVGDLRAWVATGRSGEIYVALFNLKSEKMVMSIKTKEMMMSLSLVKGKKLLNGSCRGRDVWSEEDVGVIGDFIWREVEPHGTTLFSISCSPN